MKSIILFVLVILSFLWVHCERNMVSSEVNQNEILLQYVFMHGWTGKKSSIKIFENKQLKYVNGEESGISFSESEKNKLSHFLIHFSEFKNNYQPTDGAWMDIDHHWLIHFPESKADSISIYEPLDSFKIPPELREVVLILSSKF